jgi:muramoyltetrapeptide carboxypeptidase
MSSRRHWLQMGIISIIMSTFSVEITKTQAKNPNLVKPKRLNGGDGVGLVSPAGATFEPEKVEIVIEAVKALGLVPFLGDYVLSRYGYLAGNDIERAKDINQFFAAQHIKMILPLRGGWGCARILPYLNYQLIKDNPKIIVGFSDITALILAIYAKTGLITFHGPNGFSGWQREQTKIFRQVLFNGEMLMFQNQQAPEDNQRLIAVKWRINTITAGKSEGILLGGNLSVISAMIGSDYVPNWKGAILFVEDVGESIYRIDRFLTHLNITGVLAQLRGFIFGQCTNCSPNEGYGSLTLAEVLQDHIKPLQIPAFSGAMIGHVDTIWTLAIGLKVEMDANRGTLKMLERAVI